MRSHDPVKPITGQRLGKYETAHFPAVQGSVRKEIAITENSLDIIHRHTARSGELPGKHISVYDRISFTDQFPANG